MQTFSISVGYMARGDDMRERKKKNPTILWLFWGLLLVPATILLINTLDYGYPIWIAFLCAEYIWLYIYAQIYGAVKSYKKKRRKSNG